MLSLYHSKDILATCWNYFFDFNDTQSKKFVQKGILVCCDIFLQCRSIFFNKTIVFAEPTRRPSSSVRSSRGVSLRNFLQLRSPINVSSRGWELRKGTMGVFIYLNARMGPGHIYNFNCYDRFSIKTSLILGPFQNDYLTRSLLSKVRPQKLELHLAEWVQCLRGHTRALAE